MSGAVDDSSSGWTANELAEHVKREDSTFSWIFEPVLQCTGFDIIDRDYRRNVHATCTCRVRSAGYVRP